MSARFIRIALVGAYLLLIGALSPPVLASQGSCVLPTTGTVSGLTLSQNINACIQAIMTSHSGTSAPANGTGAVALYGQVWAKSSDNSWSIYDGTNWLRLGTMDASSHYWQPPIGGGVSTIASGTTTDLWSVAQSGITISGTTTITALANSSAVPGTLKAVTFSGILTLTHNATSLILPGAANITTAAGDTMWVQAVTSTNVRVLSYIRASGLAVTPLASCSDLRVLANVSGGSAAPSCNTVTAVLDAALGSTQGQILYRGASAWSVLAPGTSGQVLQSGGAAANPSWATVSAPILLNTLTASSSASLADTTSLTATYPRYQLVLTNILPATNGVICRFRVNVGGVQTSNYDSQVNWGGVDATQTAYIPCVRPNAFANTQAGLNATITITNPSQTTSPKLIYGVGAFRDSSSSGIEAITFAGNYTGSNAAMTGFELSVSSGNIASGTIKIYGLP